MNTTLHRAHFPIILTVYSLLAFIVKLIPLPFSPIKTDIATIVINLILLGISFLIGRWLYYQLRIISEHANSAVWIPFFYYEWIITLLFWLGLLVTLIPVIQNTTHIIIGSSLFWTTTFGLVIQILTYLINKPLQNLNATSKPDWMQ